MPLPGSNAAAAAIAAVEKGKDGARASPPAPRLWDEQVRQLSELFLRFDLDGDGSFGRWASGRPPGTTSTRSSPPWTSSDYSDLPPWTNASCPSTASSPRRHARRRRRGVVAEAPALSRARPAEGPAEACRGRIRHGQVVLRPSHPLLSSHLSSRRRKGKICRRRAASCSIGACAGTATDGEMQA
ncbi:hypothetical protein ACP70R_024838 [Stipagrostis hirtigluma subsp. patula]